MGPNKEPLPLTLFVRRNIRMGRDISRLTLLHLLIHKIPPPVSVDPAVAVFFYSSCRSLKTLTDGGKFVKLHTHRKPMMCLIDFGVSWAEYMLCPTNTSTTKGSRGNQSPYSRWWVWTVMKPLGGWITWGRSLFGVHTNTPGSTGCRINLQPYDGSDYVQPSPATCHLGVCSTSHQYFRSTTRASNSGPPLHANGDNRYSSPRNHLFSRLNTRRKFGSTIISNTPWSTLLTTRNLPWFLQRNIDGGVKEKYGRKMKNSQGNYLLWKRNSPISRMMKSPEESSQRRT